jgi:hypothetical protein
MSLAPWSPMKRVPGAQNGHIAEGSGLSSCGLFGGQETTPVSATSKTRMYRISASSPVQCTVQCSCAVHCAVYCTVQCSTLCSAVCHVLYQTLRKLVVLLLLLRPAPPPRISLALRMRAAFSFRATLLETQLASDRPQIPGEPTGLTFLTT